LSDIPESNEKTEILSKSIENDADKIFKKYGIKSDNAELTQEKKNEE